MSIDYNWSTFYTFVWNSALNVCSRIHCLSDVRSSCPCGVSSCVLELHLVRCVSHVFRFFLLCCFRSLVFLVAASFRALCASRSSCLACCLVRWILWCHCITGMSILFVCTVWSLRIAVNITNMFTVFYLLRDGECNLCLPSFVFSLLGCLVYEVGIVVGSLLYVGHLGFISFHCHLL
jgi:hypothetical protein